LAARLSAHGDRFPRWFPSRKRLEIGPSPPFSGWTSVNFSFIIKSLSRLGRFAPTGAKGRIRRMFLAALEMSAKRFFFEVDAYTRLAFRTLAGIFGPPVYARETITQFDRIGVESLFIILLTGLFTGMVLALQGVALLTRFGATSYLGSMIGASIVRELGPVLAALMVAGRVGSSIAAELGNMAVTEQVDAYIVEGTDVVKKLVVPRFLACTLSLPLLTILSDAIALFGGFLIITTLTDLSPVYYWHSVTDFIRLQDVAMGLIKPLIFGAIIASTACHLGLRAQGGAEGVGIAVKKSVVVASVLILVTDFFLTKIFLVLFS
jgi:phospholipid/cholesterol/gamma-HCH transport system permease protein